MSQFLSRNEYSSILVGSKDQRHHGRLRCVLYQAWSQTIDTARHQGPSLRLFRCIIRVASYPPAPLLRRRRMFRQRAEGQGREGRNQPSELLCGGNSLRQDFPSKNACCPRESPPMRSLGYVPSKERMPGILVILTSFPEARLHEAASAADAFACSKETIWEVPDFPDRRGLRKDRSCATMKPSEAMDSCLDR